MTVKLSAKMGRMKPSLMFKILDRAKELQGQGIDIIHLEKGEPETGTPSFVVEAGRRAIDEGYTTLTPKRGLAETRGAISVYLESAYGVSADPAQELLVVPGAKFGIFAAIAAVLNPGEEVAFFSPYFPPYEEIVTFLGGVCNLVSMRDGVPPADLLRQSAGKNTKVLLLNYPHNPTGWIPSEKELLDVADLAKERDWLVVSDEVYRVLSYDGAEHRSFCQLPDMRERSVVVDSFSKTLAMTGWRVGYALGPAPVVGAMADLLSNTVTCAPCMAQKAVADTLNTLDFERFTHDLRAKYEGRRDRAFAGLSSIPEVSVRRPEGAFYLWIDIGRLGVDSVEFALRLLDRHHVAITPGAAFGSEWHTHVRISTTESNGRLEEALQRLRDEIVSYGGSPGLE